MSSERRENARYQPQRQTFVVLRPHFATLGKLIDIGKGGLAFNYMALNGKDRDATQLDIFMSDPDFYLSKMQCEIVYEAKENGALYFESWRCGVQFGELTQEQVTLLEHYLKNYSTGTLT